MQFGVGLLQEASDYVGALRAMRFGDRASRLSPLRGWLCLGLVFPTACAMGCILLPLRGCGRFGARLIGIGLGYFCLRRILLPLEYELRILLIAFCREP